MCNGKYLIILRTLHCVQENTFMYLLTHRTRIDHARFQKIGKMFYAVSRDKKDSKNSNQICYFFSHLITHRHSLEEIDALMLQRTITYYEILNHLKNNILPFRPCDVWCNFIILARLTHVMRNGKKALNIMVAEYNDV